MVHALPTVQKHHVLSVSRQRPKRLDAGGKTQIYLSPRRRSLFAMPHRTSNSSDGTRRRPSLMTANAISHEWCSKISLPGRSCCTRKARRGGPARWPVGALSVSPIAQIRLVLFGSIESSPVQSSPVPRRRQRQQTGEISWQHHNHGDWHSSEASFMSVRSFLTEKHEFRPWEAFGLS